MPGARAPPRDARTRRAPCLRREGRRAARDHEAPAGTASSSAAASWSSSSALRAIPRRSRIAALASGVCGEVERERVELDHLSSLPILAPPPPRRSGDAARRARARPPRASDRQGSRRSDGSRRRRAPRCSGRRRGGSAARSDLGASRRPVGISACRKRYSTSPRDGSSARAARGRGAPARRAHRRELVAGERREHASPERASNDRG